MGSGNSASASREKSLMITEEWLKHLDKEFDEKEVPLASRLNKAIQRGYEEKLIVAPFLIGCTGWDFLNTVHENPDVGIIRDWYDRRKPKDATSVVEIMPSVFFYKEVFWRLSFPVVYGRCQLQPCDSLKDMPDAVIKDLLEDKHEDFSEWWFLVADYAYSVSNFHAKQKNKYGLELFLAADQKIREVVPLLLKRPRPESGVNLICRDAVEVYLKAFLAFKGRIYDDAGGKKYSHGLGALLLDCIKEGKNQSTWESFEPGLALLPDVSGRYQAQEVTPRTLWANYSLVVSIGAEILRDIGYSSGIVTQKTYRGQVGGG